MLPGPARLYFRPRLARSRLWPHRASAAWRTGAASRKPARARAQGGALVVGDLEFKVAGDDSSLWTRGALPKGTTRKCASSAAPAPAARLPRVRGARVQRPCRETRMHNWAREC